MKNKLSDLHNHLFEQIERLNDDEAVEGEKLDREIRRAQAMCNVAGQIIHGGRLMLDAVKAADEIPGIRKTLLLPE
jgi:hypothetical protein